MGFYQALSILGYQNLSAFDNREWKVVDKITWESVLNICPPSSDGNTTEWCSLLSCYDGDERLVVWVRERAF